MGRIPRITKRRRRALVELSSCRFTLEPTPPLRYTAPVKRLIPYALLTLLALLAGAGALRLAGITPFGEATLAWQDNGQQVASDFGYVRGVAEGRHELTWSYACGGSPRSSLHPTFNNLCSPLTWAVAALPGLPALTGLSLLFLLQLALLPLGALFYLRRRFPRLPAAWGVALALAYAFGGFVLTKHGFLPFFNVALLFPWWVAALDSLLRRGRWIPCSLLLALMLAVGTYFAYMWLLFAAVYAAARTGWRWKSPVRQHTLTLILASAGALGLAACSWLPSLLLTAGSARAGEAHLLWNLTRAEGDPGALIYLLSLPAACCLLAALLLWRARRRLRCSRYALVFVVLMVGLASVAASSIWHVSRPWDFAGRFGYMADFMLICLAAQWAQRARVGTGVRGWVWALAAPLPALVGALLLGLILMDNTLAYADCYQSSAARVQLPEWAAQQVGEPAGRATSRGHAAVENLAFYTPFDSLSHFTACITREQEETLARWGYQQRAAVISTEGGTLATDTLLGMRYILSQADEQAPRHVEENPYYFGMGLMLPPDIFPQQAADPMGRQQELLGKLLGAEHAGLRSCQRLRTPLVLPPGCLHYLRYEPGIFYVGCPCTRWHGGGVERHPALWELPPAARLRGSHPAPAVVELYHLPLASLAALRAYGEALPVTTSYAGRLMSIQCRSTAERPLLFLPLLWQQGYCAWVDGAPAPVQHLDGFVGISLPQPGEHHVELRYKAPGGSTGMLVTAFSLPLLFSAWCRTRRRSELAAQSLPHTLCRLLLLAVSLLLLLWPLLTLPVGLWWR